MTQEEAVEKVTNELPTFIRLDAPIDPIEMAELREIAYAATLYAHGATGVTDYSDARVQLLIKCIAQDMYAKRTTEESSVSSAYVAKGNSIREMIRTMEMQVRLGVIA